MMQKTDNFVAKIFRPADFNQLLLNEHQVIHIVHEKIFDEKCKFVNIINRNPNDSIEVIFQQSLQDQKKIYSPSQKKVRIPLSLYQEYYSKKNPKMYKGLQKKLRKYTQYQITEDTLLYGANYIPKEVKHNPNIVFQTIQKYFKFVTPQNTIAKNLYGSLQGLNIPQFYFKVQGNYTTFHRQNGFYPAININIGQGTSIWYFIPNQQLPKIFKSKQKIDNVFSKAYWFLEDFLKTKNIQYYKILQQKNETIITNGEIGHFVFAQGKSKHVSWNFICLNKKCIDSYIKHVLLQERSLIHKCIYPTKYILMIMLKNYQHILQKSQYVKTKNILETTIVSQIQFFTQKNSTFENFSIKLSSQRQFKQPIKQAEFQCQTCQRQHLFIFLSCLDLEQDHLSNICVECLAFINYERKKQLTILCKQYEDDGLMDFREHLIKNALRPINAQEDLIIQRPVSSINEPVENPVQQERMELEQQILEEIPQKPVVYQEISHNHQNQSNSQQRQNTSRRQERHLLKGPQNNSQGRFIIEFLEQFFVKNIFISKDHILKKQFIDQLYVYWLAKYQQKMPEIVVQRSTHRFNILMRYFNKIVLSGQASKCFWIDDKIFGIKVAQSIWEKVEQFKYRPLAMLRIVDSKKSIKH